MKNYKKDSDKGYIVEVDVEYPKKLNHLHNELPFLPQKTKIKKCKKLVCDLNDKTRYVFYIKLLKQAMEHGLRFKKVHRVIQFEQSNWMKKYIDLNIQMTKKASTD